MIELKDLTIIFPFHKDSDVRVKNLCHNLEYINYYFNTNIIVCEHDNKSTEVSDLPYKYKYIFYDKFDKYFSKSKTINYAAKVSNTSIISINDSDCITVPSSYVESVEKTLSGIPFVIGHDGLLYHIPENRFENILDEDFMKNLDYYMKRTGPAVAGGIIYLELDEFYKCGMFNEKFVSWGGEDMEIFYRYNRLGRMINGVSGHLFHMEHPRSLNSNDTHEFYSDNVDELNKVENMSRKDLEDYINTWGWRY